MGIGVDNSKGGSFKQQIQSCFEEKRFQEAVSLLTEAIDSEPENVENYVDRAHAFIQLKDLSSAMQDANISLTYDDSFVKGYLVRASIHVSMGRHDQALEDYRQIQQLQPCSENEKRISTVQNIIKSTSKLYCF